MMQPNGVAPPPQMPSMDQHQQHQYQAGPPQQQWSMMQQAPPGWAQQQSQIPQPQQQQQYGGAPSSGSPGEIRSLWIGDLQYWMDETYLNNIFYQSGELVNVKIIRNKQTSQSEGYGFLEFRSHGAAEQILQGYNGQPMPNSEQNFRLNWASMGAGEKRTDESADHTIFVGDLAADVTDYLLQETFKAVYPSVKGAKVVTDRTTGRTKGYGFVRFGDESEQLRAMNEMNGVPCSTRAMRIGPAANKKPAMIGGAGGGQKATTYPSPQSGGVGDQGESDPNNTTIFVGGLDPNVSDEHLKQVFSQYGELVHVKIPVGKRCGFVQFANRSCAEQAISGLQGSQLGGQSIRLSWGRSPSNKQPEQGQWNGGGGGAGGGGGGGGGYYGYPQGGYEAYGYAPPPQDPNMYYGGYYQQQPQQ